MTLNAITYKKLESYAYENILSIIDTRTNVGDPKDPGNTKSRPFVYNADPNTKGLNFGDYPYIRLSFPTLELTNTTADGKHKKVMWTQRIIVRSMKDGSGNSTTNQGRTDLFNICDDLNETFNSVTVSNQLKLVNMTFMDLKKVNTDTTVIDQQTEYEAEYELTYWVRMITSA